MVYKPNTEIRLVTEHHCPQLAANKLHAFFTNEGVRTEEFFNPHYNPKLMVFVFPDRNNKEKALNLRHFARELDRWKFKTHTSNHHQNDDHKTIYVHSLNERHFHTYSIADGNDRDETLKEKVDDLIEGLKRSREGADMEKFHFMWPGEEYANPPKTLLITFKNLRAAEDFLKVDTFPRGSPIPIRKYHKRFHKHVSIRQCSICKQTNHRRGDSSCSQEPHCPKCWSTEHIEATSDCIPFCWKCKEGHSSGSNKCPENRTYVRQQRKYAYQRESFVSRTQNTAPEQRQFHRDMIRLQNSLNRTPPSSYAAAISPASRAQPTQDTLPSPSVSVSCNTLFSMGYTAACISEAYDPGSFHDVLKDFCTDNNMPLGKFRTPSNNMLRKIVPDAYPAQDNSDFPILNPSTAIPQQVTSSLPSSPSQRNFTVSQSFPSSLDPDRMTTIDEVNSPVPSDTQSIIDPRDHEDISEFLSMGEDLIAKQNSQPLQYKPSATSSHEIDRNDSVLDPNNRILSQYAPSSPPATSVSPHLNNQTNMTSIREALIQTKKYPVILEVNSMSDKKNETFERLYKDLQKEMTINELAIKIKSNRLIFHPADEPNQPSNQTSPHLNKDMLDMIIKNKQFSEDTFIFRIHPESIKKFKRARS